MTWVPPGHFYSPLVDPDDEHVRRILRDLPVLDLPRPSAIKIDDKRMLKTLQRLSAFYPELPFPAKASAKTRFYYENGNFEWGDAIIYFCMIRAFRPQRIVEVGGGFSSCLAMDTNDMFFGRRIDLRFIEPHPERLLRLMGNDEAYEPKLLVSKLQDVPTSLFEQLKRNDILFIDSSHVGKMGSDVNDYLFRILPVLKPGVIVHIHDIPYPFEYPYQWVLEENRSWNEAYLVRAFLQYNSSFEITYFNHYAFRKFGPYIEQKMPLIATNCGFSLWLQRSPA